MHPGQGVASQASRAPPNQTLSEALIVIWTGLSPIVAFGVIVIGVILHAVVIEFDVDATVR